MCQSLQPLDACLWAVKTQWCGKSKIEGGTLYLLPLSSRFCSVLSLLQTCSHKADKLKRCLLLVQGAADTKEYRQFVQHEGKDISAWHDVPLQNEDGSFNFVCEIPKETRAKMEVATVSL